MRPATSSQIWLEVAGPPLRPPHDPMELDNLTICQVVKLYGVIPLVLGLTPVRLDNLTICQVVKLYWAIAP